MKKILTITAIVALVIGLTGCNEKNGADAKRFTIVVEDITHNSYYLGITPPNEEMRYLYSVYPENLLAHETEPDWRVGLEAYIPTTGDVDVTVDERVLPDTKYRVLVAEADQEGNAIGPIESFAFRTEDIPIHEFEIREEDQDQTVPFNGSVGITYFTFGETNTRLQLSWTSEDQQLQVTGSFLLFGEKKVGHFTADDMINYFIIIPAFEIQYGELEPEYMICYRASFDGVRDDETGLYQYEGWMDCYSIELKKAYRVSFTAQCEEKDEQLSE